MIKTLYYCLYYCLIDICLSSTLPHHCIQPASILLNNNIFRIICREVATLHLHTALHVLTGGFVNVVLVILLVLY